jgi:Ca2+-binding EF-hand superfamily protein
MSLPSPSRRRRLKHELLAAVGGPPLSTMTRSVPLPGLSTSEYLTLVASRAGSQREGRDLMTVLGQLEDLEVEAALDAFRAADVSGTGTLERRDFARLLRQLAAQHGTDPLGDEECEAVFVRWDVDGSGELDINEILQQWAELNRLTRPPDPEPAPLFAPGEVPQVRAGGVASGGAVGIERQHLAIATRSLQAPPYFIRACPII